MRILILTTLSLFFSSCSGVSLTEKESSYWADSFGDRRLIIKKGELKGRFDLSTLQEIDEVYGIGPVDNLKGEVTIYSGVPYIADFDERNKPRIQEDWSKRAIFLAYGKSNDWIALKIERNLTSLKDIEMYVRAAALKSNLELEKSFPFRIEGQVKEMEYHIIYKGDEKPHNKKEHKKSKRKINVTNEEIKIIGFWAKKDKIGVYTHPGKRTHLHFISDSKKHSGHIDDIVVKNGARLFLPLAR